MTTSTAPFERRAIRLTGVPQAVAVMAMFATGLGMNSKAKWSRALGIRAEIVRRWARGTHSPYAYQLWVLAESVNCDIVLVPREKRPPKPGPCGSALTSRCFNGPAGCVTHPAHLTCQHRHGASGECPVVPTYEVEPRDCEHGRWNPDNRQCLDCGQLLE
jgi:hypothetical protein